MFSQKFVSLLLISLIGFIDIMGMGLVYPMFSSMLFQGDGLLLPAEVSDGVRGACLGVLLAMMPLTQFFSAPILGMLSDRMGRKKVLVPALGVGVLGYLIAMVGVLFSSLPLLLLSRVAVGISGGTVSVVGASLADISRPEEKAKNFGLFNMACGLGFTVGPFIGGILSSRSLWLIEGYALPFAAAGIITLINLLMILFFYRETFTPKERGHLSLALGLRNIQKAFLIQDLRATFAAIFLACMGWSFYWEFMPVTWIDSFGFDTATIGNFYAYGAAVYAVSCGLLVGPIVNRFSNAQVLCFSIMACGIAIGMLLFHTDPLWLWVYIPLQQCAIALFWPTAATAVSNAVGEEMQGEILGVLHSLDALAFVVSPLIAGPLLGISYTTPMFIGCSAMLAAAAIFGRYSSSLSTAKLVKEQ